MADRHSKGEARWALRLLPALLAPATRFSGKQGEPRARTTIMNGPLEWYAAISGVIAAFMVAGDFGRKTTGLGFLLFATGSIAWIIAGLQAGTPPLAAQNAILLLINLYGMWQYWLSPKNRRKIEVIEAAVEEFEEQEAKAEAAA